MVAPTAAAQGHARSVDGGGGGVVWQHYFQHIITDLAQVAQPRCAVFRLQPCIQTQRLLPARRQGSRGAVGAREQHGADFRCLQCHMCAAGVQKRGRRQRGAGACHAQRLCRRLCHAPQSCSGRSAAASVRQQHERAGRDRDACAVELSPSSSVFDCCRPALEVAGTHLQHLAHPAA